MATATKTLKLAFLRLNASKAAEFARLQAINTELANRVLEVPKKERRSLTTASFRDVELGSAWINQTLRNANARTKVKRFRSLPLETNNQNWTLHKVGETYSISFGIVRGVKKRVPLEVSPAIHGDWLDAILNGTAKAGSLKLSLSKRGVWYALISVSKEVPDAVDTGKWIGIDRGHNIPAVAALPDGGHLVFFQAKRIQHMRRENAKRRKKLQKLGKHRAVKKMEQKERRTVTHINHTISKRIVGLAARAGYGLRFEDLTGIRHRTKQRKTAKSDNGKNHDYWPFFQLEMFCAYKSELAAVPVEKMPAPYTSKTHHACGRIGIRNGHDFYCPSCDRHEHSDGNAARNVGGYIGLFCAVEPSTGPVVETGSALPYGRPDTALNSVRETNPQGLA